MKSNISFIKIALSLFLILAIAGGVGFIVYYTNNFSTDLTTFYVQHGAQEIRRDTGKMKLDKGVYYTFKVNYPLGFPSSEKGERYKVSVDVTEAGKEIEYKVDGRLTSLYPKPPEITSSFEIVKTDSAFTFRIPEETTIESILRKAYEGKTVTEIPQVDFTAKDYICLTVKSYNEKDVIKIGFGFEGGTKSQAKPSSSSSGSSSSGTTSRKYGIEYDTLGSGSVESVKFDCVSEAAAGDTVTFKVSLVDLSSVHDDYYPVEITNIVLREEIDDVWIGQGEGTFSFTMPAHFATIMIYLMPAETPTYSVKYVVPEDRSGSDDFFYAFDAQFDYVSSVKAGETVKFTLSKDMFYAKGYKVVSIGNVYLRGSAYEGEGQRIGSGEGSYSFTMPKCNVTVYVSGSFVRPNGGLL